MAIYLLLISLTGHASPFTMAPSSRHSTIDTQAIAGLPNKGPNCYFTALTVNSLLRVPATTLSDNSAALLFLNPALCTRVFELQAGDIGLEENMVQVSHVFTVVGPHRRFEKAGSAVDQPFGYVNANHDSASQFVRCSPMTGWIKLAIASADQNFEALDAELRKLEQLIDLRNGAKNQQKGAALKEGLAQLEGLSSQTTKMLREKLRSALAERGVNEVPFPGMLNGDYYRFAKTHPDLLQDPHIFSLLWLSSRLADLNKASTYYPDVDLQQQKGD